MTNETKKFKALKKVQNLTSEINHASHDHHMTPLSQELQERYVALQETVSDQEIALVEMGKKLSGQGSVMLISVTRSADLSKKTSLTDPLPLCPSFLPQ